MTTRPLARSRIGLTAALLCATQAVAEEQARKSFQSSLASIEPFTRQQAEAITRELVDEALAKLTPVLPPPSRRGGLQAGKAPATQANRS